MVSWSIEGARLVWWDSLDDAQPFGDHGETLGVHVPGFELGVQGFQPDLFVPPLVFAAKRLLAGVPLDGVAGRVIQNAETLDQQNLVLPRARWIGPEKIQAAVRDARLH